MGTRFPPICFAIFLSASFQRAMALSSLSATTLKVMLHLAHGNNAAGSFECHLPAITLAAFDRQFIVRFVCSIERLSQIWIVQEHLRTLGCFRHLSVFEFRRLEQQPLIRLCLEFKPISLGDAHFILGVSTIATELR